MFQYPTRSREREREGMGWGEGVVGAGMCSEENPTQPNEDFRKREKERAGEREGERFSAGIRLEENPSL